MQQATLVSSEELERLEPLRESVQRYLANDELAIPLLPDVAVKVVRTGSQAAGNAQSLANIISADQALTMYVLRIAASAAKRPVVPILSLQHAVAWLGLDEVANIAFTVALQGKMLDVKGQQGNARRLWRHSLASALWSRQLAHLLVRETGLSYLCGLLHSIGKVVTLGAVHDVAKRTGQALTAEDYDVLVQLLYREVGKSVICAWRLPPPIPLVVAHWEDYRNGGAVQWECNVVHVAHLLADFTLHEPQMLTRDLIMLDPSYSDLGFSAEDGERLFDCASSISGELDHYLSP